MIDARRSGDRYVVTWIDAEGRRRSLTTKYLVVAGSKYIAKHILSELDQLDPAKRASMEQVDTAAYLVANVLLDAPIQRDLYDLFLINNSAFPTTPGEFEAGSRPLDVLHGGFAEPRSTPRTAWMSLPKVLCRSRRVMM